MAVNLWTLLYGAWMVSELLLIVLTRTRNSTGTVRDRGSLYVLWVVIAGAITLGTSYGRTHRPTIAAGAGWVEAASVWVLVLGLGIRWSSIYSLGRSFSVNVAIHAGQRLYRGGLFRLVRHPSYSGLMLVFLAAGLRTRSWVGLAILVVPPLLALLRRMHVEEQALTHAFGARYTEYSRTTKRLVPGVY